MKFRISLLLLLFIGCLPSCQSNPSDEDIQKNVNDLFKKDMAGAALNATVDSGVATITGQCEGNGCTAGVVEKVRGVNGVKDVQTHIIEQP